MNNKAFNSKGLIILLLAILMTLSMSVFAFADDEDQLKEEELPKASTLEGFWLRYDPEDIGYHVTDNMEKICILGTEEPLEIKIVKEENDGSSLLDHFLEVTVTNINNDITEIFYEQEDTPDYEMFEEDNALSFIFNKGNLECPYDAKRYEFLFNFDDGQANGLVWATNKDNMLEYTEDGHVWFVPARDYKSLEEMGVYLPTLGNEPALTDESALDTDPVQLLAEEAVDEAYEESNIMIPVIIICALIVAVAAFVIYRSGMRKR